MNSPDKNISAFHFLLISLYFLFNVWIALSVGWGGASNAELGMLFLLPIMILATIIFVTLSFRGIKLQPVSVFWCLLIGVMIDVGCGFYISDYHLPLPSINSLITIPGIIAAYKLTVTNKNNEPASLKEFKTDFFVGIICIAILFCVASVYSYKAYNKKMEDGRTFAQQLSDRENETKRKWNEALSSGLKVSITLNGKPVQNAGLYFKIIQRNSTIKDNEYIDDRGDEGTIESFFTNGTMDRLVPGEYMFAPIITSSYDSCYRVNPNFDKNKLIFRGPFHIGGKITDINIDLTDSEYKTLLYMRPPQTCN